MKMQLELDYKVPAAKPGEKSMTPCEMTIDYILYALNNFHKAGVKGQKMRIIGRIQRALDKAEVEKATEVEFERAEAESIIEAAENADFPPMLSKFIEVFLVYIRKVKLELENPTVTPPAAPAPAAPAAEEAQSTENKSEEKTA